MLSLPISVLLIISIFTSAATSMAAGAYTKRFNDDGVGVWRYTFLSNAFTLLTISFVSVISGMCLRFSLYSSLFGLLLGAVVIINSLSKLLAQGNGSFAYTNVIAALSAVIPIVFGLIFFSEHVTWIQYCGLIFMALCVYLSNEKEDGKPKFNFKWLGFCLILFISGGSIGVVQKFHQRSLLHKEEIPSMLICAFIIGTIFSGIVYLYKKKRSESFSFDLKEKKLYNLYPALGGITLAFPHMLNLFLSGKIPSIIFFPTVNLTPLIIVMILSVLILKERLELRRWIGIAFGILSTVFFSGIIKV